MDFTGFEQNLAKMNSLDLQFQDICQEFKI